MNKKKISTETNYCSCEEPKIIEIKGSKANGRKKFKWCMKCDKELKRDAMAR